MQNIIPFHPLDTEFKKTMLIEASAGTGKTYTIASLVIRLILEKNFLIERILVVSFTEAASSELKERIFSRLNDVLRAFQGLESRESFSEEIAERYKKSKKARQKILRAIENFDKARIVTIHAFSYSILKENPFESGILKDTELINQSRAELIRERACYDVWVRENAGLKAHELKIIGEDLSADKLLEISRSHQREDALILPERKKDISEQITALKKAREELKNIWIEERDFLIDFLIKDTALNRAKLRVKTLEKGFENIENWIDEKDELDENFIAKLSSEEMKKACKKNFTFKDHSFYRACGNYIEKIEELNSARKNIRAFFIKDCLEKIKKQRELIKEKGNLLDFSDLLIKLEKLVSASDSSIMLKKIRSLFDAALIDEFQDTDPLQYSIFHKVFIEGDLKLILIGDPKQAIYAFRGADVFTYLKAARESSYHYTLNYNWRSDRELIEALNSIFTKNPEIFLLEGMHYLPVNPASRKRNILKDTENFRAFNIWLTEDEDSKKISMTKLKSMAMAAVSDEIVRLLEGGEDRSICIGEEGVRAKDIAILVRSNNEALYAKNFLMTRGIKAIIYSDSNLFESSEAEELYLVLKAVLKGWNPGRIKRALVTSIMGYGIKELKLLNQDERAFNEKLLAFAEYKKIWKGKGIFHMLAELYKKEKILEKSALYNTGEACVTNLLHLAEVLHKVEKRDRLSPHGLISWFERQKNPELIREEENTLRLESDQEKVRILTIHRSKGLEFPLIFCPFIYSGNDGSKNKYLSYHDPELQYSFCVDFEAGKDMERKKELSFKEELAEQTRLIYVAFTRAIHRVYTIWGRINRTEKRAVNWILHGSTDKIPDEKDIELLKSFFKDKENITFFSLPEDKNRVFKPYARGKEEAYCCKADSLFLDFSGITSFSSLTSSAFTESSDIKNLIAEEDRKEEDSIFSFPYGARAGNFIHHILENIEFDGKKEDFTRLIQKGLYDFGYEEKWLDTIADMLEKLLELSIGPEKIQLKKINKNDKLKELEFYLPLKKIRSREIENWLQKVNKEIGNYNDFEDIRLNFNPDSAYLKGVMDLVFRYDNKYYLLDWKYNMLGESYEDYLPEKIREVMIKHNYTLQYHLYLLALNRYLESRLINYDYNKDFGGVIYIFLRGIRETSDYGVFFEKPPLERIQEMESWMLRDTAWE